MLLTPCEKKVAELVARYQTNKEIATALNVSERTVKFHVSNILAKLRITKRAMITPGLLASWRGHELQFVEHLAQRSFLSPREIRIAHFAIEGYTNQEIGDAVGISKDSAARLVKLLLRKLRVGSRYEISEPLLQAATEEARRNEFESLLRRASDLQKKLEGKPLNGYTH